MVIAWILFRVTDKPAFNLLVKNRNKEYASYGMYAVESGKYYYMISLEPNDEEEMFIDSIDYLPEVLLLLSIGVSHEDIRKQYEVEDDD